MARVAIFTDSASDLDPAEAAASGIHIVPLIVNFGDQSSPGMPWTISTMSFFETVSPSCALGAIVISTPGASSRYPLGGSAARASDAHESAASAAQSAA